MKNVVKHLAAVLLGLLVVNGFCAWYYNTAPYEHTDDRATDTVRRPGARVSQATEGMGAHAIDANGYNSAPDDRPISVLMLGSSHTEGFNVAAGQDVSARLGALLGKRVYNLGMSAHTFTRNAANLPRALARFKPADWVVLETASVVFTRGQVEASMGDALERLPATRTPLPDFISNRPLSKRLYKQLLNLMQADEEEGEAVDYDDLPPELLAEYEDSLTAWFAQLKAEADASGVGLIIWYHPHVLPDAEGNAVTDAPAVCLRAFHNACRRAGVTLVDLSDAFLRAWERERILPHGFANTALGVGHLNAEGHRMAAEALYEVIGRAGEAA